MTEAPSFLKAAVKAEPKPEVNEDRLTALRAKVAEFRDLELEAIDVEARLETINEKRRALQHQELPTLFDEVGIEEIKLGREGNSPAVQAKAAAFYKAAIAANWSDEKRQDAFACLTEEGVEDLIKTTVTVALPRGQYDDALLLAKSLREQGFQVIVKEEVHHGTLTSWLKDMVENHNRTPPLDRIGGVIGRIVKLKVLKA